MIRKSIKYWAVTLAIVAVMAVAAGCGGNYPKAAGVPKIDKVKIGLSIPNQREARWVRDKESMEDEAKKMGIDLVIQISDNNSALQASQCDNLIAQGVKVLIIGAYDGKTAAAIVEKAHTAGVKVIAYDRLIPDSDVDLYMAFDNEKIGELQGRFITEKVVKGNYMVLTGDPSDKNAVAFRQGAMKFIKPLADKGDIKVVFEQAVKGGKADEAAKQTAGVLTAQKNDIQAVLAPNDEIAGGVVQALAAQGLAGKVIVTGQDSDLAAARRIVAGTQSMTIFKDERELGEAAVDAAVKMAKGDNPGADKKVNNNKREVPAILFDPVVVTKDNLDRVLIDSGCLKKEDVYKP